jgi:hypothetical protein
MDEYADEQDEALEADTTEETDADLGDGAETVLLFGDGGPSRQARPSGLVSAGRARQGYQPTALPLRLNISRQRPGVGKTLSGLQ